MTATVNPTAPSSPPAAAPREARTAPESGAASFGAPTGEPASLADRIDAALPQTQCTRCGFPDCRAYADALAAGAAELNQCPPGGAQGVQRLARILGRPALPLAPAHGAEGPRRVAFIEETACIGCTLCIQACPVEAIVGAPKRMHTVIETECTGCELCLPACPVDCILLENASADRTGWQAWSPAQADAARARHARRRSRLADEEQAQAQRLAAAAAPAWRADAA